MEIEEIDNTVSKKKRKHRFLIWYVPDLLWEVVKYAFIGILLIVTGIYFLIQIPSFQNYTVSKLTSFLSKELHATVSIGRVKIVFVQTLQLEDFLILDRNQDTLLYAKFLEASLNGGLVDLLDNKIDIKHISLKNVTANLIANGPEYDNNYQFLLNYLERGNPDSLFSKPKKNTKQVNLKLNSLDLEHFKVNYINHGQGKNIDVAFNKLNARFKKFDLNTNDFSLRELKLDKPIFRIRTYQGKSFNEIVYIDPYKVLRQKIRAERIPQPLKIHSDVVSISEGAFKLDKERKLRKGKPGETLDFNHLDIVDINISLANFDFTPEKISSVINNIALNTGTPLNVKKFQADKFQYTPKFMSLSNFDLVTNHSHLQDQLRFNYQKISDFEDFIDKVVMEGSFTNAVVGVDDIVTFEPKLRSEDFFRKNAGRQFYLSGRFKGTVNDLQGSNVDIGIGKSSLKGGFHMTQITDQHKAYLDIQIDQAETDAKELDAFLPEFKLTPELIKLGRVKYQGIFKGYLKDFNIDGKFQSAPGNGYTKLHLDIRRGVKYALYDGLIGLQHFDLGKVTGRKDLGVFSGEIVIKQGSSLDLNNLAANFNGQVSELTYNNYTYKNVKINGAFKDKSFTGDLSLRDENADLDFSGTFDFSNKVKILKFNTDIKKLDLDKLKLAKTGLSYAGRLESDLTFSNIDDLKGDLHGHNLVLTKIANGEALKIDTLNFSAKNDLAGRKIYALNTDLIDGEINGRFRMEEIGSDIQRIFHYNHTKLANQFHINSSDAFVYNHDFDFNFYLKNTKNLFNIIDLNLDKIEHGVVSGKFKNTDSTAYDLYLNANIPELQNEHFSLKYFFLEGVGDQKSSEYFAFANNGSYGNTPLTQMDLSATLEGNLVNFNVKTPKIQNAIQNLNIDADYTVDSGYQVIRFNQSKFDFLDDDWTVNKENEVRFGHKELIINNLTFDNGVQNVAVNSYGKSGLDVDIQNFSFGVLKGFLPPSQTEIKGLGHVNLKIDSVFSMKNINLTGTFDSVFINTTSLGAADIKGHAESLNDKLSIEMVLGGGDKKFNVDGYYTLPQYSGKDVAPNYLKLGINSTNYPVAIAEAFLGDMISSTKGIFASNLNLEGKVDNLNVRGTLDLKNFATTINYLGTRYFVTNYTVQVNNNLIDLDNLKLIDERGNIANVSGGIRHNRLKDFRTDLEISSENFLLLKTTEKQNGLYYGTAAGEFRALFNGPFDQMNINIDAVTGPRTEISLPTTNQQDVAALSFIEFKNKFDTTIQKDIKQLRVSKGLDLKMNLDINENATMNIIFDKQSGDAIRGQGNGHLELDIPRNGTLNMYGTYEIAEGEYKFTIAKLFNLSVINTPFIINKGGTIVWSGDPFAAQINIDAYYKGLNPSPYSFLYEYLPEEDRLISEASKPTPVDLSLNLKGELLKPQITFKLAFPQISPELKTYVDSKLAFLEQNPNELNKQAAFLITFRSFVPQTFTASSGLTTLYNTLSELVSNQLSQVISPLINQSLIEGKVLSGLDLKMAYLFYDANTNSGAGIANRSGKEFQFGPRISLFNDRLVVNPEVKTGTINQSDPYVAGDIEVQYAITPDRQYLARVYQKSDAVFEGRRIRSGVGFTYQKTVDTFWELFKNNKKKDVRKSVNQR